MSAKINDGLTRQQRHYRKVKLLDPTANLEHIRQWRAANRERDRANSRASYARNRAKRLAAKKAQFEAFKLAGYSDPYRLGDRLRKANRRAAPSDGAPLTPAQWLDICARFNHACAYCSDKPVVLEQDHVVAISQGGAHTASNVVPACKPCNSAKGDKSVDEFMAGRAACG